MSVGADRHSKSSRQTEVCQFDLTLGVDEEVLGLQVPMKNSVRVAESQALQQLEEITLETQDSKNEESGLDSFRIFSLKRTLTFTKASGMPVTEEESMNFLRS